MNSIQRAPQLVQVILACVLTVIGIVLVGHASGPDPVPASIRQSVPFTVYYASSAKLPEDCNTDVSSFSTPQTGVVLFAVVCSEGKLVISEQQQPARGDLQKFYASLMPRHQPLRTSSGTAQVGLLINGTDIQNAASLPVGRSGPWIIVTASPSVTPQHLRQVVESLRR